VWRSIVVQVANAVADATGSVAVINLAIVSSMREPFRLSIGRTRQPGRWSGGKTWLMRRPGKPMRSCGNAQPRRPVLLTTRRATRSPASGAALPGPARPDQ
jgi:hypothetical protein